MGNRFSRRREAQISNSEAVAAEQKTAEEPEAVQPAEDSVITEKVTEAEDLVVVGAEPVTPVVRLPSEECVSECKQGEAPSSSAPVTDPEPEPEVKDTNAQVQPEPLVSASVPSVPEQEPAAQTKSVAEAQLAPESVPEPEAGVEAVPEPIAEPVPAPAEPLEQQASQEPLPEPVHSSPPLVDLDVPDVTPSPDPISVPANSEEQPDIAAGEQCQDSAEAAETSTLETEESAETTEKPAEVEVEAEAAECSEQPGSDVNEDEESISDTLKNLELKGNDLVSDLISSDVNIPDGPPITDMNTSTELM
ncbi:E3 ubiquitin-protein ligase RNF12-B-like [Mugil cephalus]|uniref:E3 ubiquitin-protein ligase RNF12-B-like n=1 Tax=Mugil cephalus TaxID=48193 RepID=UPI001FB6BDEF|nr:E3 ubiquitin-protein ligase RNF12-B-like [Mugil cephalus]XP_047451651.1 E3 ubiquitin-protein ligase RNF12-B-like [Mugil cephalus]